MVGQELTRRTALGLLGAAAACPSAAFAVGGEAETLSGRAFGTYWRMTAPPGSGLDGLAGPVSALFSRFDRQVSPWRSDSAVSALNGTPARVRHTDPELVAVTSAGLEIARRSDGAFDPTVGPLVARWGFGPITRGGAPGWRDMSVSGGAVLKARDDLTLDLCGIAKGRALDLAASLAAEAGISNLLMDLGGEIIALGGHSSRRSWRIGIEVSPGSASPPVLRIPSGAAVATSGIAGQSYVLRGRRYGHIIDPRTGAPAAGALFSVTVVAPDAMSADGWATALFAAGPGRGPDMAETRGLAAVFLIETGGDPRQVRTGDIGAMIL